MRTLMPLWLFLTALFGGVLILSGCDLEANHSLCAQIGACAKAPEGEDGDEDDEKKEGEEKEDKEDEKEKEK